MSRLNGCFLALFVVLLLLLIFKVVIANPNSLQSMALLLRGRGNAAGQGHRMTIELFLKRDGKQNIKDLKIIAPVGSELAWTINQKSAHGIIA